MYIIICYVTNCNLFMKGYTYYFIRIRRVYRYPENRCLRITAERFEKKKRIFFLNERLIQCNCIDDLITILITVNDL